MSQETVNRIYRSDATPAPTYLPAGSLAYSSVSEKLFIGMGTESGTWPNLDAVNHFVIGGKLYVDMLDHAAGTLTASSAILVDASKKINELLIDNLWLDGNTIAATNTNGTIYLLPDGSGTIDFSGFRGTSADDPVNPTDLANKRYVDNMAFGIRDFKDSVRVATTANITLSGAQTIDGVSAIAGDRVLVKNQSTASQNGIYVVASGAWSRSEDADTSADVTSGLYVLVEEGSTYAGNAYVLSTPNPIVLGTTALTFTQFSSAGTVSGTTDRITVSSGVIDIAATYVGQSSITTLGTISTGVWQGTSVKIGYGGTGITSYTAGDLLYFVSGTSLSKLAIGSTYQVLKVVGGAPSWGDIDGGTF